MGRFPGGSSHRPGTASPCTGRSAAVRPAWLTSRQVSTRRSPATSCQSRGSSRFFRGTPRGGAGSGSSGTVARGGGCRLIAVDEQGGEETEMCVGPDATLDRKARLEKAWQQQCTDGGAPPVVETVKRSKRMRVDICSRQARHPALFVLGICVAVCLATRGRAQPVPDPSVDCRPTSKGRALRATELRSSPTPPDQGPKAGPFERRNCSGHPGWPAAGQPGRVQECGQEVDRVPRRFGRHCADSHADGGFASAEEPPRVYFEQAVDALTHNARGRLKVVVTYRPGR